MPHCQSDIDSTMDSVDMHHLENHVMNKFDNNSFEYVDNQPKKEYYMSLRRLNGTMNSLNNESRFNGTNGNSVIETNGHRDLLGSDTMRPGQGTSLSGTGKWNFGSKKMIDSTVIMLDGTEQVFSIKKNAIGQQLFDAICAFLQLTEVQFFGITYRDKRNNWFWLKMNKPIVKQLINKRDWMFEFQVRYYPFDIDNLKEYITRYYLCLQVRQDIVSGQLPCSFYIYAMLGGYIVQSEAGDHNPRDHIGIQYIKDHPFAPQHLQTPEMMTQIVAFHKNNRGQAPEEADRNFLENARKLAFYGLDMHRVKLQGKDASVGVNHAGLVIYENRVVIRRHPWPSIIRLGYKGNNFTANVRTVNSETQQTSEKNYVFECTNEQLAKRLLNTCKDRHRFFRLSQQPRKPSLLPTFGTRRYHFMNPAHHNQSLLSSTPGTVSHNNQSSNYSHDECSLNGVSNGFHQTSLNGPVHMNGSRPPGLNKFSRNPNNRGADEFGWFTMKPDKSKNDSIKEEQSLDGNGYASQMGYQPSMSSHSPGVLNSTPTLQNGNGVHFDEFAKSAVKRYSAINNSGQPHQTPFDMFVMDRPKLPGPGLKVSLFDRTTGLGVDKSGLDVAALKDSGWQGCRANSGVKAPGGFYYEVTVLDDDLVRVGWSTSDSDLVVGNDSCGFAFGASNEVGASANSPNSGLAMNRGVAVDYGRPLRKEDVVGCYLDLDKCCVFWSINGQVFPRGFTIPSRMREEPFIPAASLRNSRLLFNFGDKPFFHRPQDPYWTPVSKADMNNQCENKNVGWRMSRVDCGEHMDISADGLIIQTKLGMGWHGARANKGVKGIGRFYYEVSPMEQIGMCRVGWGTDDASLDLGTDALSFGYGADSEGFGINGQQGKRMHNNIINACGEAYTFGDVIGCLLDTGSKTVKWTKNGILCPGEYQIPDSLIDPMNPQAFFPIVTLKDCTAEINFGNNSFKYYPGPDWTPLCTASDSMITKARKRGIDYVRKGWSYVDNSVLDSNILAHIKLGQAAAAKAASRAVDRHEENLKADQTSKQVNGVSKKASETSGTEAGSVANSSSRNSRNLNEIVNLRKNLNSVSSPTKSENNTTVTTQNGTSVSQSSNLENLPPSTINNIDKRLSSDMTTVVHRSEPEVISNVTYNENGKLVKRTITRTKVVTASKISETSTTSSNGKELSPVTSSGLFVTSKEKVSNNQQFNSVVSGSSTTSKSHIILSATNSPQDDELNEALRKILKIDQDLSLNSEISTRPITASADK